MAANFAHRTSIKLNEVLEAGEFKENDLRDGILSGKLVPSYFIDGVVSKYLFNGVDDWNRSGTAFKKAQMFLVRPRMIGSLDCDFEFCAEVPDAVATNSVIFQFGEPGFVRLRITLSEILENGEVMQAELQRFRSTCDQQSQQILTPGNQPRWPWGAHQTKCLEHLEAAAVKFWKNYEPLDPTTASTNETVSTWLQDECGVSERMAEAIASMLRADNLKPGPQKKVS